jgi:putative ABC transport system permease protein
MDRLPWIFRMAWRDSRGSRRRLLLYLSSMVLGVAALVAINGFGYNLERTVDNEAKKLLGADLAVEQEEPFADSTMATIDSLLQVHDGQISRRVAFNSMAYFPKGGGTRLSSVRATEGGYPYYGAVGTRPDSAAQTYRQGRQAIVDGTLLSQFDAEVGDSIRIGRTSYRIAGEVVKTPRESALVSALSPRVYIPMAELDTTLFGRGSRVEYQLYLQFDDAEATADATDVLERIDRAGPLDVDTVEEEAGNWREGLTDLYRFLSLVGFVALLLGSLGVASAVHVYVRRRVETIAVLRCLGAKARRTFGIYLTQAALMGLTGATVGALLGTGVQVLIPRLLADFLPLPVEFAFTWQAVALGLGVGVGVTMLFALWPLLGVRTISPMRALRSEVESTIPAWRDPWRWAVAGAVAAAVTGFAVLQSPAWEFGVGYAGGLAVVFFLLTVVARGLMAGVRRYFPSSWAYPWRQGLANLYRPNNQTTVLMLSMGLGTFLIMTLFFVQRTLLQEIQVTGSAEGRPNIVLFDVQPDQVEGVTDIIRDEELPVLDQVPIVTTRLQSVKGKTIEELRQDTLDNLSWAHVRDYQVTYRRGLIDSETLVRGEFVPEAAQSPLDGGPPAPVSIEEEIMEELNLSLGDTLTFDVQGVPVPAVARSVRQVDWQRIQTNFFVVFPEGVLEDAPQTSVVLSRAPTEEASARLQSRIVERYPNVSAIDLSLVLSTVDALVSRLSFVIQFMALFSILTGIIVLIGSIVVNRYQRIEESVLLKTLGASRSTVLRILTIEYLFLGFFAALTGLVLALGASWALSYFVFEGPFVAAPVPILIALAAVMALTVVIGLANSRDIYRRPPLEVLRAEV